MDNPANSTNGLASVGQKHGSSDCDGSDMEAKVGKKRTKILAANAKSPIPMMEAEIQSYRPH